MAAERAVIRDDRVLPYTRVLSAVIVPFLIVAFVLLYVFPTETKRLFAWTINPTMTPMTMASAYLGGAYFFVRVIQQRQWHVVRTGFLSVTLFASLLGIATVVHWDRFNHQHPAFWVWAVLYFAAPFLVLGAWLANRRYAAPAAADERQLGRAVRWMVATIGVVASIQGIVMFVVPSVVIPIWPWALTPLTCRVVGAIFCLGCASVSVLIDPRWTSVRLLVQVQTVMLTLIALAAVRAKAEFDATRPLTWVLLTGFAATLVGTGLLWVAMERQPRPVRQGI